MNKLLVIMAMALMTTMVHAEGVDETIVSIETQKDAKCTYVKTTPGVCLGDPTLRAGLCYNWVKYKCLPNDVTKKSFKLKLKVRQVGINQSRVTKIKYIYKK